MSNESEIVKLKGQHNRTGERCDGKDPRFLAFFAKFEVNLSKLCQR